jgi:hypothetical protein
MSKGQSFYLNNPDSGSVDMLKKSVVREGGIEP